MHARVVQDATHLDPFALGSLYPMIPANAARGHPSQENAINANLPKKPRTDEQKLL
jgi:hypothetical protein